MKVCGRNDSRDELRGFEPDFQSCDPHVEASEGEHLREVLPFWRPELSSRGIAPVHGAWLGKRVVAKCVFPQFYRDLVGVVQL